MFWEGFMQNLERKYKNIYTTGTTNIAHDTSSLRMHRVFLKFIFIEYRGKKEKNKGQTRNNVTNL